MTRALARPAQHLESIAQLKIQQRGRARALKETTANGYGVRDENGEHERDDAEEHESSRCRYELNCN